MIATELIGIIAVAGALILSVKLYLDHATRREALDRKRDLELAQIDADSKAERAAIRANARQAGRLAELQALSEVPQEQDPITQVIEFVSKNPEIVKALPTLLQGGQAPKGASFQATSDNQSPPVGP